MSGMSLATRSTSLIGCSCMSIPRSSSGIARMGTGTPGYWATTAAAFALLIVDIVDDGAIWNYGVVVCIIIAIAVRPGGVRGPRAAAADEPAPRST